VYTTAVEGKFIERRIQLLENYLGPDIDVFGDELKSLNEHDHFAVKRLIKYHCFEAPPELTDVTAKAIIQYVLDKQERNIDEQIIETLCKLTANDIIILKEIKKTILSSCDGDFYQRYKWDDFCKFKVRGKDDGTNVMRQSTMISAISTDDEGHLNPETSYYVMLAAISYSNLRELKILNAFHSIYPGMNTDLDIDEFTITPLGEKLISFIDLEEPENA